MPLKATLELSLRFFAICFFLTSHVSMVTDEQMQNSRKHASIPIPASILVRVRELAEMQSLVPPDLSLSSKYARHGGRSVHETRPGYL